MSDKQTLDTLKAKHEELTREVSKVIVGQEKVVKEVTMAILLVVTAYLSEYLDC